MFLLNVGGSVEKVKTVKFTIQNVPIKSAQGEIEIDKVITFTIQNVPIKY